MKLANRQDGSRDSGNLGWRVAISGSTRDDIMDIVKTDPIFVMNIKRNK